jgi:hypothetical protein
LSSRQPICAFCPQNPKNPNLGRCVSQSDSPDKDFLSLSDKGECALFQDILHLRCRQPPANRHQPGRGGSRRFRTSGRWKGWQ